MVHQSMPGYVEKLLIRFNHERPKRKQHFPHPHILPTYGAKAQYAEDPALVKSIVAEGSEKARKMARETMREVRDAMGLNYS